MIDDPYSLKPGDTIVRSDEQPFTLIESRVNIGDMIVFRLRNIYGDVVSLNYNTIRDHMTLVDKTQQIDFDTLPRGTKLITTHGDEVEFFAATKERDVSYSVAVLYQDGKTGFLHPNSLKIAPKKTIKRCIVISKNTDNDGEYRILSVRTHRDKKNIDMSNKKEYRLIDVEFEE